MDSKKDKEEFNPSVQSVTGLNSLLFCVSDIRHGIGPLLAIHLKSSLHWDSAKIGMALASVEFSAFLSQMPAGYLADVVRKKRFLVAFACSLIILGCLCILFFSSFSGIIFAQLLMGISIALISPTIASITLGLFGRNKFPTRVGKNEVWNHTGNVFTALSAGLVSYLVGTRAIFILLIGFSIGSLLSLLLIKPKEINYAEARELPEDGEHSKPTSLSTLFKRSAIIIFNISLILYYLSNGAQMALLSQVLAQKIPSLGGLFVAICMIIAEFTMIGIAYIMSRVVNRFNRKTFFLTAFCILPIRALLYTAFENPYLLLLIQFLDGAAAGILGVIVLVINSDLAVKTGRFNFLQGVASMCMGLGEAMSQIYAGFIAKAYGYNMGFFSLAFIGLIGILFFFLLMPETKRKNVKAL